MKAMAKAALMPHFKCEGCKTRLYSAVAPAGFVGDLCPGCGSPLEPVGELTEILGFQLTEMVGFQSIKRPNSAADDCPPSRHRRLANRVNDLFDREQAVAQAIALTAPSETP